MISYANGQPQSLTFDGEIVIQDIQYFPTGGPESWLYKNGREYTRYIDRNGHLWKYLIPGGRRELTFDSSFRITTVTEYPGGLRKQNYTYDNAGQLLSFSGFTSTATSESQVFTYDLSGNRLTATTNGIKETLTYTAGTNRVATSVKGTTNRTFAHDQSGNITSDGISSFSYNDNAKLLQVNGTTLSNQYEGSGYRIFKGGVQPRIFFYHQDGRMLGEYDAQGNPIQEFIWLGETMVGVHALLPGQTNRMVAAVWNDHINTPRAITREYTGTNGVMQSQVLWKWDTLPFGETLPNENPSGAGPFKFNHRFPGQYLDEQSGLHQNGRRDYSPALGRYLENDPAGMKDGTNMYPYAKSNPVTGIDPLGLYTEVICWGQNGFAPNSLFGHISINVNGHNYSWEGGGWNKIPDTASFIDAEVNDGRSGEGAVVGLSADQEQAFEQCLKETTGNYNVATKNCATVPATCLKKAGINFRGINGIIPWNWFRSLEDSGLTTGSNNAYGSAGGHCGIGRDWP